METSQRGLEGERAREEETERGKEGEREGDYRKERAVVDSEK